MPISAETVQSHLAYTAWASRLLVDAARSLTPEELTRDFGTADKSVLGTLVHIFAADRVWLDRVQGRPRQSFLTEADQQLSVLENDWPALLERWQQLAGGLTDETAGATIAYTDLSGNPFRQPLGQIVLHLVNHGTHHRGQVAGFLRTMGHQPPKLDLIFYYREQAKKIR